MSDKTPLIVPLLEVGYRCCCCRHHHLMDLVGKRLAAFLGKNGRLMLRKLADKELETQADDPACETRELRAHLDALNQKIDSVIDLAASSPENKDLLTDRLGRLRKEKREIEGRLSELAETPARIYDPEAVVDTILEGIRDASRLFEHGTMEERKRVVRAFVEGLTIDGQSGSGEVRMKKLPAPELASTGSSFQVVAWVRHEAQQRNRGTEVVRVRFEAWGRALVPRGDRPAEPEGPQVPA